MSAVHRARQKEGRFIVGILCLVLLSAPLVPAQADGVLDEDSIVLAAMAHWPPYTDADMSGNGLLSEICFQALSRRGYTVKIRFLPWKRALEMTRRGLFHGLIGASLIREREKDFAYPRHFLISASHFFTAGTTPRKFTSLSDLCPAKLGVLQGSFWVGYFSDKSCFEVEAVPTIEQNLQKLIRGRVDLVIETKAALLFHLNHSFPQKETGITAIHPPVKLDRLFTVFSRKVPGYEGLVHDYDMGIEILRADGTYARLLEKHGIKEPAPD